MQPFVAPEKRSDCMFVSLGIQNAMNMGRIVFYSFSGSTLILNIIEKRHDFRGKGIDNKMCVGFPYNICLKHFLF